MDFLALMEKVGFVEVELVGETGFNSSPVTRGLLFRARRREGSKVRMVEEGGISNQEEAVGGPSTAGAPEGPVPKTPPS